jgi:hypothetical protein
MANGLFDTDYSFLGLPEVGSAVGKPINISQAAINQQLSDIDEVTLSKQQLQDQLQLALIENDFNKIKSLQDQIAVLDARETDLLTYLGEVPPLSVSEAPTSTDIQDSLASVVSGQPSSFINAPVPEEVLTAGTPSPPEISPVFPTIESPTPIRERPVRVTPFNPGIPNRISNPTDSMTSRSMGLDSPIAISGSMPVSVGGTGGGGLPSLGGVAKTIGSGVEKAANLGIFGLKGQILSRLGRAVLDKLNPPIQTAPVETSAPVGGALVAAMAKGAPKEQVTVGDLINIVNARAASGDTDTKTALANLVRNAKAAKGAADNAAMTAGIARDKASAMNTLYGAAGSSFESGRDAYTESGQYDIDREARQAEFDAMRQREYMEKYGVPKPKLTREETARALADLQSRIGFGGAMSPANDPFSTIPERVAPDPNVEYELVSGFNVPKPRPTVAANNQGIAPFMGVPSNVMRGRGRGGGARK